MKDSISNIKHTAFLQSGSAGYTDTTDRQGYNSMCFLQFIEVSSGAMQSVTEESDDGITWNQAPLEVVYGDKQQITSTGYYKIGYTGYKRYVRLHIYLSGTVKHYTTSLLSVPSDTPIQY